MGADELAHRPVEPDVGEAEFAADLGQRAVPAVDALGAVLHVVVAQGGSAYRQVRIVDEIRARYRSARQ